MTGNKSSPLPLVSVVINCFNGEEFLKGAIESVYAQTFENWEIIFWNNCSTDGSVKILEDYDKKIKYFESSKKLNLGDARNSAIQKCNGDYITFIDCDDIWISTKLEKQINLMKSNENYVLSYTGIEEINKQGNHLRYINPNKKSGILIKELLIQYDIPIISTMINRKLLKSSGLNFDPEIQASEEYCLFMQLACQFEIGVLNEILVKYRVHDSSLTSSRLSVLGMERRYTLDRISSYCKANGLNREFKEALDRSYYYDARWYMSNKKRFSAICNMKKIALNNYRYFILFFLTFLPYKFWNYVHIKIQGRI